MQLGKLMLNSKNSSYSICYTSISLALAVEELHMYVALTCLQDYVISFMHFLLLYYFVHFIQGGQGSNERKFSSVSDGTVGTPKLLRSFGGILFFRPFQLGQISDFGHSHKAGDELIKMVQYL